MVMLTGVQWTPDLPEAFALLGFSFYVQPVVSPSLWHPLVYEGDVGDA